MEFKFDDKLRISLSLAPGVSVGQLEIPISGLVNRFRRKKHNLDPKKWLSIMQDVGNFVLADRIREGIGTGGWGYSYWQKCIPQTYPDERPEDSTRSRDSFLSSAMVLEELMALDRLVKNEETSLLSNLDVVMSDFERYAMARYDPLDGRVGGLKTTSTGEPAVAPHPRHTAMALRVWEILGEKESCLRQTSIAVMKLAEMVNLQKENALSLAALYSGVQFVVSKRHLVDGVKEAWPEGRLSDRTAPTRLDAALVESWNQRIRGWQLSNGGDLDRTANWYSTFVLREVGPYGENCTPELRACLLSTAQRLADDSKKNGGIPYIPGKDPDFGLSCMLLEALYRLPAKDKEVDESCDTVLGFLESGMTPESKMEYTYSWTAACLFGALESALK